MRWEAPLGPRWAMMELEGSHINEIVVGTGATKVHVDGASP